MPRDDRYEHLLNPVLIGPIAAKSRFNPVSLRTSTGIRHPHAIAARGKICCSPI
ncbi:MAG: hypothetical protein ACR2QW_16025 [bacterium]